MSELAPSRIRFTRAEYERMADAGIFGGQRVELIAGRIKRITPQKHRHMWAMSKINRLLVNATTANDWLIVKGTLWLNDNSAPEPDFHLFDVPGGTPEEMLPLPILVIEVSHKTYRRDSGSKLRVYAAAGIEDYWIVHLRDRRVEVYRRPENPTGNPSDWRYASVTRLIPGQSVAMLKRPNVSFSVDALLP